jgi:hypothetical protein
LQGCRNHYKRNALCAKLWIAKSVRASLSLSLLLSLSLSLSSLLLSPSHSVSSSQMAGMAGWTVVVIVEFMLCYVVFFSLVSGRYEMYREYMRAVLKGLSGEGAEDEVCLN